MAKSQSAMLDRKKLMADPIMVLTIVVLITFLTLFILYPLAILLVDSFYGKRINTKKRGMAAWAIPHLCWVRFTRSGSGRRRRPGRS